MKRLYLQAFCWNMNEGCNKMKNKTLINYLCLSGIISVIFYLLHDIIGAMNYPNYNWLSQAVSDLTAANSPSFIIANEFLTLYKIFNCLCSAFDLYFN